MAVTLIVTGCGANNHDAPTRRKGSLKIYDPLRPTANVVRTSDIVSSATAAHRSGQTASLIIQLKRSGSRKIEAMTLALARRGAKEHHAEHFVLEFDGRIYARPIIDYRRLPQGMTDSSTLVFVNLRPRDARFIATELRKD